MYGGTFLPSKGGGGFVTHRGHDGPKTRCFILTNCVFRPESSKEKSSLALESIGKRPHGEESPWKKKKKTYLH